LKDNLNFDTPVAVIVFNRPDKAMQLKEALSGVRPSRVFVIADGPRAQSDGDADLCAETRAVFDEFNWPCRVTRIYSDKNLGVRDRILTGLDELFSHVGHALILEDDCLPDQSFFEFAHTLLAQFDSDNSVAMISGNNFGFQRPVSRSVGASKHALIWGWATWANRWQAFRASAIGQTLNVRDSQKVTLFFNLLSNPLKLLLLKILSQNGSSSWAAFWASWVLLDGKKVLIPGVNLVQNTGFGDGSTHTSSWVPDVSIRAGRASFPLQISRLSGWGMLLHDMEEFAARAFRWLTYAGAHPILFARKALGFIFR